MLPSVCLGCSVKREGTASVIHRLVAGGRGSACFSVFWRPGCCRKGERPARGTGGLPGEVGPWPGTGRRERVAQMGACPVWGTQGGPKG